MSTGIGLASGLDYTTLVSQLMQIEAQPQKLLETRLSETRVDASAYRAVNTAVSAMQTAAEALTKATTWTPVKASSSSSTVTASAATGAAPGSVTFTVDRLAARHARVSAVDWAPPATETTLTVTRADGTAKPVTIAAGASVQDAAAQINRAGAGVTATVLDTGAGHRIQLTASASGADGVFSVSGGLDFKLLTQGADAQLTVGAGSEGSFPVTSSTNTFSDLLPGVTFTVAEKGATATVTAASDPSAVTAAVQALVTAVNSALTTVNGYSYNGTGSTAALRGDSALRQVASDILSAVSYAVGNRSPATAGVELTREGAIKFTPETFTKALESDPALAQALLNGTSGTGGVPGVAQRVLEVAKRATDATTGTLTRLAKSKDDQATELEKRIDDWDLRLDLRKQSLTRQFTAMESALGALQNQSSWLSSQLSALPSWSKSSSD
ncbi:flagellar filament capping protein FliD [Geodermatophilus obscurus]|nr:flagellar filament capping protein FliD [Geodermatophilus obscurus]